MPAEWFQITSPKETNEERLRLSENPITLAPIQGVPGSTEMKHPDKKEHLPYLDSLGNAIAPLGEMAPFLKLTLVTKYQIPFHPLVSYLPLPCCGETP